MKKGNNKSPDTTILRKNAEALLTDTQFDPSFADTTEDLYKLVHELQVYQIELKMQNEELLEARSQTESALEKYTNLYDFAPCGYFTLDSTGNICNLNFTAARLLGRERALLIGQSLRLFVSNEMLPIFDDFFQRVFSSGTKISCELSLISQPQLFVIIEGCVSTEADKCFLVAMDISYQKKLEKERALIEANFQNFQRLESIGVLAGGIAHDFNNLLAGIFGYMELARDYAKCGANDEVVPTLDNAFRVFDRAKDLTQRLLTFAKGGGPRKQTMEIALLLKSVASFSLSGSKIDLVTNISDDLWHCDIDENQISQAIDNIMRNAREAMPDGGVISLTATNLSANNQLPQFIKEGRYVLITIANSGPAIPSEIIQQIFDPFFTTKDTGHGLGLSIAYSVIVKHGGLITVESAPDKQTVFNIYLPATSKEANLTDEIQIEQCTKQGNVLIVDDEPAILDTASKLLESMGYSVVCATNGENAIDLYKEALHSGKQFNTVILDLTIRNGMGGLATIRELRAIDPNVKAIACSGYADDPPMSHPEIYGFKDALAKPYQKATLERIMHKLEDNNLTP